MRASDRTMGFCQGMTRDVLELKGAYTEAIHRAASPSISDEDRERAVRFADGLAQRILDRIEAFPHDKVDRDVD